MSANQSNIRVFVRFKEDTVFAGESIECTITFKHVEPPKPQSRPPLPPRTDSLARPADPLDHLKTARGPVRPAPLSAQALATSKTENPNRNVQTHRHTASLNVVDAAWKQQQSPISPGGATNIADSNARRKHEKKISIVSLDSDGGTHKMRSMASASTPQRPGFKHGRSASVQYPPSSYRSMRPPSVGGSRSVGQRSPLVENATSPGFDLPESPFGSRRPSEANIHASASSTSPRKLRHSAGPPSNFKFPPTPSQPPPEVIVESQQKSNADIKQTAQIPIRSHSPRAANGKLPGAGELVAPAGRVFSVQSMDGTPRSSLEIYSTSNHSDETLASELPSQPSSRLLQRPFFGRTLSQQTRITRNQPETLMMGYVQIHGSFILDGSLVNQAPFEEVKRKAVVGGQGGGGVVGITKPADEGGLFGSFSWGSLGQSIGGLLGSGEMSSIKEMKGIADSRTIPLISTAKSILFVDLRLAPGQSRSYNYKFKLPRGLPPTHKGRAMKVAYKLVIGTQRPSTTKSQQQQIKQVEVPFRVFCSINSQGEPLGHDLMSPYIILKDQAQVAALDLEATTPNPVRSTASNRSPSSATTPGPPSSSEDDFRQYIQLLLTRPRRNSSFGLLSPTAEIESPDSPRQIHRTVSTESSYSATAFERATPSPRALIEQAIRASMHPTSPNHTPTSFTIARSSVPIATVTLSRPALKLGDNLIISIDFSSAQLPSYAIEATLESAEKVDPALAIRSAQSVERATRRIWARTVENCQWARRTTLNWQIPANATPAFGTTGVGLEWCVRLEIVVALRSAMDYGYEEDSMDEDDEDEDDGSLAAAAEELESEDGNAPLQQSPRALKSRAARPTRELTRLEDAARKAERMLEVLTEDERGTTLAAVPRLACESFEVTIPIRVFGAVMSPNNSSTIGGGSGGAAGKDGDTVSEEGLAI